MLDKEGKTEMSNSYKGALNAMLAGEIVVKPFATAENLPEGDYTGTVTKVRENKDGIRVSFEVDEADVLISRMYNGDTGLEYLGLILQAADITDVDDLEGKKVNLVVVHSDTYANVKDWEVAAKKAKAKQPEKGGKKPLPKKEKKEEEPQSWQGIPFGSKVTMEGYDGIYTLVKENVVADEDDEYNAEGQTLTAVEEKKKPALKKPVSKKEKAVAFKVGDRCMLKDVGKVKIVDILEQDGTTVFVCEDKEGDTYHAGDYELTAISS